MTLTEFLLARIAEDEKTARLAAGDTAGRWRSRVWDGCDQVVDADDNSEDCLVCAFPDLDMPRDHVAQWDPARVLAECEAKRRIVEGFECYLPTRDAGWMVADVFKILALPYADHPDFDLDWKLA